MFYLLLIVPHVVALGALFVFAFRTEARSSAGDDGLSGEGGGGGNQFLPRPPTGGPGGSGLPLDRSLPPSRRLGVGEQLADLYRRPQRREHPPVEPRRTPAGIP